MVTVMEISTTGDADGRIAALEKKVRDLDALVRGLTAELLDIRTITLGKSRMDGERGRQGLKQGTVVQKTTLPAPAGPSLCPPDAVPADERIIIRPKGVSRRDDGAGTAGPAMARIMQADGTMKLETRHGNQSSIDSSQGDRRIKKGGPGRN